MSKQDGGPAFPRPAVFTATHGLASVEVDGMTLRDYFAAKAMQSLVQSHSDEYQSEHELSADAYEMADAMLKARGQQ